MSERTRDAPVVVATPLLLAAPELADLLRASVRSIRRADAEGLLPRPIRLGRSVRWRRLEIEAWITAGCPPRASWERQTRR